MRIVSFWRRNRVGLVLALAAAGPAVADDGWSLSGYLNQRFQGDTNLSLDSAGKDNGFGSTTSVGMTIGSQNSRSGFSISPGLTGTLFTNSGSGSKRNRISPRVSARMNHRTSTIDLSGGLSASVRPTSFSELDDSDEDPVVDIPDLDLIRRNAIEISTRGNFRVGYDIDRRNRISIGPNVRLKRYTNDGSSLSPSTSIGGSFDYSHKISDSMSALAGFGVRHVDIDGRRPSRSIIADVDAGLRGQVSRDVTLNGRIGASFSDTKRKGARADSTGVDFNANISLGYRISDDLSLSLRFRQALEPSSNGELQERSIFSAGLSHSINSRENFDMNLGLSRQGSSSSSAVKSSSRHQVRASLGYGISFTREISARVGYGVRWRPDSGRKATSHNLFVNFSKNFTLQP